MLKFRHCIIAIVFLTLASVSVYGLSCGLETGTICSTGIRIMGMSSATNAHAQNISYTTYIAPDGKSLCCEETSYNLYNTCNTDDDVILRLSAGTNAHVQTPAYSTYTQQACISSTIGLGPNCTYTTDPCEAGFEEVVTISALSNAHVAQAGSYDTKVCCKIEEMCNFPADCNQDCEVSDEEYGNFIAKRRDGQNYTCGSFENFYVKNLICHYSIKGDLYGLNGFYNQVWPDYDPITCKISEIVEYP